MPYPFLLTFLELLILRYVVRALYIPLTDGAFFNERLRIVLVVTFRFSLLSIAAEGGLSLSNIPA